MSKLVDIINLVLARPAHTSLTKSDKATLSDWGEYLAINGGLALKTVENYLHAVAGWIGWLYENDLSLSSARPLNVNAWQRSSFIEANKVSATRTLELTAVRQFYRWRELNEIYGNPAINVRGPKKVKRMPRKLSDKQLRGLFSAPDRTKPIGRRDFAILLFFYNTGARRMDVAGLKMHSLVLRSKTGFVKFISKGGKERIVPFEGPVVSALEEWLVDRHEIAEPDEDNVFVGLNNAHKGGGLADSGVGGVLTRMLKKAGIVKHKDDPFGVHRLRSSYATAVYDDGKDIKTVQYLLGHEKVETTEQYIAISDRQMQQKLPGSRTEELLEGKKNVPGYIQRKTANRL